MNFEADEFRLDKFDAAWKPQYVEECEENTVLGESDFDLYDTQQSSNSPLSASNSSHLKNTDNETSAEEDIWKQFENCSYTVGLHRINISNDEKGFEFLIRPDISEESILSLVETVLISIGGILKRIPLKYLTIIRVTTQSDNHDSIIFDVYIGVNQLKQRILFIHVKRNETEESKIQSNASALNVMKSLLTGSNRHMIIENVINQISDALFAEGLLLQYIHQLYRQAKRILNENGSSSSSHPSNQFISLTDLNLSTNDSDDIINDFIHKNEYITKLLQNIGLDSLKWKDSIVDPCYIRDLQAAYAYDMIQSLQTIAISLEQYVANMEKKCARFMTLLKPTYNRCQLTLPPPPNKRPLESFPLDFNRKTMEETSLEMARLLILRSRKAIKQSQQHKSNQYTTPEKMPIIEVPHLHADIKVAYNRFQNSTNETEFLSRLCEHFEYVNAIVKHIHGQLREWLHSESKARISRKSQAVTARVADIDLYKLSLLQYLHNRNIEATTTNDLNILNDIKQNCRVITSKELYLLDVSAVMSGKTGMLYVTCHHIYFHSSSLFMGTFMKLIPLQTIEKVIHKPVSVSIGIGDSLVIEDKGGHVSIIEITNNTPEYCSRLCDLINVLLEVCHSSYYIS
jgi:hypothetical protein